MFKIQLGLVGCATPLLPGVLLLQDCRQSRFPPKSRPGHMLCYLVRDTLLSTKKWMNEKHSVGFTDSYLLLTILTWCDHFPLARSAYHVTQSRTCYSTLYSLSWSRLDPTALCDWPAFQQGRSLAVQTYSSKLRWASLSSRSLQILILSIAAFMIQDLSLLQRSCYPWAPETLQPFGSFSFGTLSLTKVQKFQNI